MENVELALLGPFKGFYRSQEIDQLQTQIRD